VSAPTAWIFPGQGSQRVGMGLAWAERHPAARATFDEANAALGFDLAALCWQGPEGELQLTANTQPAILAASIAIERVLRERGLKPVAVAGHSLGEYSAHVAAGTLALGDALRLVRRRGELMQAAVPVGVGAMAAVIGLDAAGAASLAAAAAEGEICAVANFNSPEQTVLAGHRGAIERAVALAKAHGAKRALPLPVSAPFHCAADGAGARRPAARSRTRPVRRPALPGGGQHRRARGARWRGGARRAGAADRRPGALGGVGPPSLGGARGAAVHRSRSGQCAVRPGAADRPEAEAIALAEPDALDKLAEG
jgi:[acyl-carrier-protein] S-malonyltransferase